MPDSEGLTPEEMKEVRALLRQRGLNTELPKKKMHRFPPKEELSGGFLERLGVVGQYLAWTWKVGASIVTVLLIPIVYQDLVEYYDPKTHAVVEQIAQVIDGLRDNVVPEVVSLDHQASYVGFNPKWQSLSEDDLGRIPVGGDTTSKPRPEVIISSSNTTADIISASGIVKGLV